MNEYTIHVYPTVAGMLLLVVCHLTMGNVKMSHHTIVILSILMCGQIKETIRVYMVIKQTSVQGV